jgi:hypothetical protein
LFEYRDGRLYWRHRVAKNIAAGTEAGYVQGNGYKGVTIDKKMFQLHRVIYMLHCGEWPEVVDHIDGNVFNNRIENLRAATREQNSANSRIAKNNTSGVKNVSWCATAKKWTVMLSKNKKAIYFGRFASVSDAEKVARAARKTLFGEFARHV